MKVCFVTTSFIRSANDHYARFVFEQARSLTRADAEISVVVVAPHGPGLAAQEVIDGIKVRRVRYFFPVSLQRLAYRHEGLFETVRSSWLAAAQLPFLLLALTVALFKESRRADVLHAQWVPTAAIAVLISKLRGIPVVLSVRGADLNAARESWLGQRLTRAVIGRVDYVVTVSDEFRDLLIEGLGSTKPVAALYNGVDTTQFRPRDRGDCRSRLDVPADASIVLYVGGLIRRKGLDTLVEAMSAGPLPRPVDLFLAGEGPELAHLEALAAEAGSNLHVHFLGKVSRDRIHLWMGAADLLVLPSLSEGRPNVVLEGLSSGTPVAATAVNGTKELIRDGTDGLLFRPGDRDGLLACIRKVLEEPATAAKLSANGPLRIAELGLSWPAHGRRLLDIYRQLTGAK